METCDVLIVGGGPAGSTCAWQLRQAGFDVVVMDKARFPRDKTCAGWIVPQVVESLQLDVADYAVRNVWQPITGFQLGLGDRPGVTVRFDHAVSYGIRRCEFDDYLLRRCGARMRLGESVDDIQRVNNQWVINGRIKTPVLIGAGGNLCPVARHLRGPRGNPAPLVTAVELEISIAGQPLDDSLDGATPRLYFCDDLAGYGWCVRKQTVLNLGIGRVNVRDVPAQWDKLLDRFRREHIVTGDLPQAVHGHAYHVYDGGSVPLNDDGVLLIGDSAGLADPRSGEGIRPAIESGLLAAETIQAAQGRYDSSRLLSYSTHIQQRFGAAKSTSRTPSPQRLSAWQSLLFGWLIGSRWFSRQVILKRWFLHSQQAALQAH